MCLGPPGYPCNDSFTYEVSNAVWGFRPGKGGLGNYQGNTAAIVGGTGRFASASGNLNVAGPFLVWPDDNSLFGVSGRWNGEISGSLCGVQ